jgi:hypothetical protein
MFGRSDTVKMTVTWYDTVLIVIAGLYPGLHGAYWACLLSGAAMAAAIGIWRAVRFLGHLLMQAQSDADAYDEVRG